MMLLKLVSGGPAAGIAHVVVSLAVPGAVGSRLAETGVRVHTLGMGGRIPFPWHVARLRRIVATERPDILHGWMPHGNLAAWVASLGPATPLIWGIRQSLDDLGAERWTTRVLIRLAARLSRRPARIVYNSHAGAEHHEALGYAPTRTVIIPNGFDTDAFAPSPDHRRSVRAELGIPDDAVVVGMVARYDPMKDHRTLVAAAALLAQDGLAPQYLLAGRGVDEANAALSAARAGAGLLGRMHLLGERADTARLFAACDVAVLASAYGEGFPNVLGEAMACGTPCVSTAVGEAPAIVGDTGRLVPPRNPAALAEGIRALITLDPAQRRALGAAARRRILRDYALAAVRDEYARLYRDVRARRDADPRPRRSTGSSSPRHQGETRTHG
jgi:glycosyltransferase involved in cell wall biosynthesis